MSQKRRRKSKKWLYWLAVLVLVVVAGVVVYLVWDNYFADKNKTEDREDQETTEVETEPEKKEEGKGSVSSDESTDVVETEKEKEKEKVMTYEGENPNNADELTGAVTYAAVNGDNLTIRVNIDQYLNGGACELNVVRGGEVVYIDAANIVSAAATATCEGFNVPASALGAGEYSIIIYMSSGERTGTIRGTAKI